ncbi:MAG: hypothetical protein IAE98_05080, partial [Candidatus Kapabacteria bacterium]|nr:hypothetical protein [Candidatus Kapabacteria bacterium]
SSQQFSTVGRFGGITVKVLKLKDLNDNLSISALRFEYDYSSKYSTDTKIATLDNDEVEGLVKSIKNLQSNVFTSTRETYTEVTFTSRNDFQAGAYFSTDKQNWVSYIKLSKYDSNSIVFIQQKDLETLLGIIEIAKLKMK